MIFREPPRSALWVLAFVWRGHYGDSLTGDLIEQFQQGRSRWWFWRQVVVALLIAPLRSTVRKWLAVFGLVALGAYLSFRVLGFPDLTVEGSFPLGAAVAAVLISTRSFVIRPS